MTTEERDKWMKEAITSAPALEAALGRITTPTPEMNRLVNSTKGFIAMMQYLSGRKQVEETIAKLGLPLPSSTMKASERLGMAHTVGYAALSESDKYLAKAKTPVEEDLYRPMFVLSESMMRALESVYFDVLIEEGVSVPQKSFADSLADAVKYAHLAPEDRPFTGKEIEACRRTTDDCVPANQRLPGSFAL